MGFYNQNTDKSWCTDFRRHTVEKYCRPASCDTLQINFGYTRDFSENIMLFNFMLKQTAQLYAISEPFKQAKLNPAGYIQNLEHEIG